MATKSAMIRARTSPDVKALAEEVFERLGLTATDAINMFYHQVALRRGIPFEVSIPNETTKKAIEEARSGKGMKKHKSVKALFDDLGI
jgi:DNA-damage-inducible protein J